MNRRYQRSLLAEREPQYPVMLVLTVFFVLGAAIGCALASVLETNADSPLFSYLEGYFKLVDSGEGAQPSTWAIAWEIGRWPLISALLGSTVIGLFAAPMMLLFRGSLLAYAISVFVRFFGITGFFISFIIFGIPALISVFSLFVVGLDVFSFFGSKKEENLRKSLLLFHFGVVVFCMTGGSLLQHWIVPILLKFFI